MVNINSIINALEVLKEEQTILLEACQREYKDCPTEYLEKALCGVMGKKRFEQWKKSYNQ